MKIIDAHMHYYDIDKFYEVAENAGHENTAACWQQICQENNNAYARNDFHKMHLLSYNSIITPLTIADAVLLFTKKQPLFIKGC